MDSNSKNTLDLPYVKPLQQFLAELATDPETGLNRKDASDRILQYGYNRLP